MIIMITIGITTIITIITIILSITIITIITIIWVHKFGDRGYVWGQSGLPKC